MANEEKKIWGIHTQDDNLFLKDNLIAIGWRDMGDLNKLYLYDIINIKKEASTPL